MTRPRSRLFPTGGPAVVLAVALTLGLAGCGRETASSEPAGETAFLVAGIVRAPLADGQVVIEHGDIPGFMPAMTMPFIVENPAEAARLAAGDRVHFRFIVGERSRAVDFEIVGHESGPPPNRTATAAPAAHRLKPGDPLPPLDLVDQDGRPLRTAAFEGRAAVATFIFTRCPVPEFCPAMMQKFRFLQDDLLADAALGARTRLLAITLDPEFDRPEILRAYGQALGADFSLWRFATGEPAQVEALARAFSVFAERSGGTIDHTLCTALIGPDGRIVEFWRGNGWKAAEVLDAVRAAAAR